MKLGPGYPSLSDRRGVLGGPGPSPQPGQGTPPSFCRLSEPQGRWGRQLQLQEEWTQAQGPRWVGTLQASRSG